MSLFQRPKIGRLKISLLLVITSVLFGLPLAAHADNFFQGFTPKGNLQNGNIVAVDQTNTTSVVAAPANDPNRIYGVIIDPKQATITLELNSKQVFVATTGNYPVLVSNFYGSISVGDYISVSDKDGIGARASSDQDYIVGQATQSFDGTKNVLSTYGKSAVGRINVNINAGKNPVLENQLALPGILKKTGTSLAGHTVAPVRIWGAFAVFLIAASIAVSVMWIGVRSAITAIGRNPLSQHSILMGLVQVILTALTIFIIGIFTVYLLLRI